MNSHPKLAAALLVCCSAVLQACAEDAAAPAAPAAPERRRVGGFSTPESVLHDEERDVYLVSNIVGSPVDKDDNGFISRVSPDGDVLDLKWIDGASEGVTLSAPKGMAIAGGKLYVADIDAIRVFDAGDGAPIASIEVPGASLLNDIAALPDGSLVVSDTGVTVADGAITPTGTDALVAIGPGGEISRLVADPALPHPNGVAGADGEIWVAYLGAARVDARGASGEQRRELSLPAGSLDGIVRLDDGRLLVSSWDASAIFEVDPRGEGAPRVSTLASDLPSPADLGWDRSRGRLLVPLFNDGEVVLLDMK
ncbi:SMP-30/gluconolactonase/LRE family protein [Sorangium sp. So ce1153]|uniref:SMP-30/gluconolactonase/LRE family protein n=1 Tax=Sorangium sp. So ce1153 TaxID=3133333 RepID=UPI003F623871